MKCSSRVGFSWCEALRSWASAEIFQGGNADILLIIFELLKMQCKWTFTKSITLSTPQRKNAPCFGSKQSQKALRCEVLRPRAMALRQRKLPVAFAQPGMLFSALRM